MRPLLFLAAFLLLPSAASAATLSLVASPATTTGQFVVSVVLSSSDAVNAVEGSISIPASTTLQSIGTDNSLGFSYVAAPSYTAATRTIDFAGIIPGGWKGKGTIFTFVVSNASFEGIAFSAPDTHVYRNDGVGSEAPLTLGPISARSPPLPLSTVLLVLSVLILITALYWLYRHVRLSYR